MANASETKQVDTTTFMAEAILYERYPEFCNAVPTTFKARRHGSCEMICPHVHCYANCVTDKNATDKPLARLMGAPLLGAGDWIITRLEYNCIKCKHSLSIENAVTFKSDAKTAVGK
jgi:hypothetical protein